MGTARIQIAIEDIENVDLFLHRFSVWLGKNVSEYSVTGGASISNETASILDAETGKSYIVVVEQV